MDAVHDMTLDLEDVSKDIFDNYYSFMLENTKLNFVSLLARVQCLIRYKRLEIRVYVR